MYIIERVSGVIFKKDVEHKPYKLTQWQHTGWEALVGAAGTSAAAADTPRERYGGSRPSSSRHRSSGSKIKDLLKSLFCMGQYACETAYEARKDINDMRRQLGLKSREIRPPPVFPPYEDSSEESAESAPPDQETLAERMNILRRERRQSRPQRHTTSTHRAGRAVMSDSEEESDDRAVSSGKKPADPSDAEDSDIGNDWSREE
jgi:hypothetical protein